MNRSTDPLKGHRELMASITDPLKGHRELLASITDPLKEHRELMASIADPLKGHRELLASITDPLKGHRELLASIADPLKEHRELMASIADPLKEHRELMASITDPLKGHRELMASIADPLKEHRELMASITDPLKNFLNSIAAFQNPLGNFGDFFQKNSSLNLLKDIAFNVQQNLSINSDGVLSLSSKQITAKELQVLSNQIINDSTLYSTCSLEDSINNLIQEIKSQKDPLIQKILIWFIYPLIVTIISSFINPTIENYVESNLYKNKQIIKKEFNKHVTGKIKNKDILKYLRYVTADSLNVRASNSNDSEKIGSLKFAYAVVVIDKKKNWTLIEWNDPETEAKVIGWVFSRYLAKFK